MRILNDDVDANDLALRDSLVDNCYYCTINGHWVIRLNNPITKLDRIRVRDLTALEIENIMKSV